MSPYKFDVDKVNPEALKQTQNWYDARGKLYRIDQLDYSYVKHIIAFLYAKCHKLRPHDSPLMRALKERQSACIKEMREAH